jgi:hypothetical protein
MMQTALQWAQPLVTVVSLTFGGGVLYGDIQDLKQSALVGGQLDRQVQVMEVKLAAAEDSQEKTVQALERVAVVVDKLNSVVIRLETKMEEKQFGHQR